MGETCCQEGGSSFQICEQGGTFCNIYVSEQTVCICPGVVYDGWGGEAAAYGPRGWPQHHTQSQGCKSPPPHTHTHIYTHLDWQTWWQKAKQPREVWAEHCASTAPGAPAFTLCSHTNPCRCAEGLDLQGTHTQRWCCGNSILTAP